MTHSNKNGKEQFSHKRKRKYRRIFCFLFLMFFLLFLFAACSAFQTWRESIRNQKEFEKLAVLADTIPAAEIQIEETEEPELGNAPQESTAHEKFDNQIRFSELYSRNPDFIGWLSIENTAINYPVMCTPDEPEYYLHRDYNKEKSSSGIPFFGESCDLGSDNIIIYGHNMKNGTMFSDLTNYSDESYYLSHPTIVFDALDGDGTYDILAVFRERVHYQEETGVFRYYEYGGDLTEEQFDNYLANIRTFALYNTGITAEYGDRLLTLSTCDYHTENGRFVVVARETKQDETEQ